MTALDVVELMNREDRAVVDAVAREAARIATAIETIAACLARGGRLIYLGAGTSGRLGALDAAECPPTFRTPPEMVVALVAGGPAALTRSIEGAEDDAELGAAALAELEPGERDAVVGIAASGRTPWVLGGVERARRAGATTIGLCCSPGSPLVAAVDHAIVPLVGPEVLAGSTRLKAGTATKMVLNMLTTGALVRCGKTYRNLMVDVHASNDKLRARARRIVRQVTGLDDAAAAALLDRCGGEVKTSLVAHGRSVSPEVARELLAAAGGHLRRVLETGCET